MVSSLFSSLYHGQLSLRRVYLGSAGKCIVINSYQSYLFIPFIISLSINDIPFLPPLQSNEKAPNLIANYNSGSSFISKWIDIPLPHFPSLYFYVAVKRL